ncbi:MAG: LD-carboxypeptidase [Bacteroidales bacterium]|nr:LD-carboxypeptidase [Bacteroidales bacterium]
MTTPPYLKKGDKIALVSPARKVTPEEISPAKKLFESWGLEVVEGENLYAAYNQFAGSDAQRTADMQRALDDDSIRAIVCSRGGYGTVRIIDRLDFNRFASHPKWIVGFSDITVLHSHIHRHLNIETLHAIMPVNIRERCESDRSLNSLRKALFGKELSYRYPAEPFFRKGSARAQLVGGNLSILYSLTNTRSDISTNGKILFIEDLDEYLYHIDRMMLNLRRSGKLEGLAGLIVGAMSKMHDNEVSFQKSASDIIAEAVEDYPYPVCFNFPAGHGPDNRALILGREVGLEINDEVRVIF